MTNKEICEAYNKRFPYLPITEDKVEDFMTMYPIFRSCEDEVYLLNMLYQVTLRFEEQIKLEN